MYCRIVHIMGGRKTGDGRFVLRLRQPSTTLQNPTTLVLCSHRMQGCPVRGATINALSHAFVVNEARRSRAVSLAYEESSAEKEPEVSPQRRRYAETSGSLSVASVCAVYYLPY